MIKVDNYFEQVYAGVLGKVIGVYMGRPFEGWKFENIQKRWGVIDHYVYKDQNVPLVVSDDDISGTFTFVKALEESGKYAETPADFFGDNWLNYLIENKTILWWGGMGVSTEHTAYIRLKNGVRSPESGSMKLNGKVVSEQIGAQIFIDGFGMVAPGNPELAMELAEKAARVSHDGEAVIAAKVVAAMVSLAFVDKDIHSILDKVLAMIPAESMIAGIHRDVRKWAKEDGDWRKTYYRIKDKYGYEKFGGGCHVVPNHALMVMAWEYAGNDFFESQKIVNTCGWDTDCNAANVGTVCGLICGVRGLDTKYCFHSHPEFADRVVLPTADGTDTVTDCLQIARYITRIGCKISGIPLPEKVANAKWQDFSLFGALHGYIGGDCNAVVRYDERDGGSARLDFSAFKDHPAYAETPVLAAACGHYTVTSTPAIYHGMTLEAEIVCDEISGDEASAYFEVVCMPNTDAPDAEKPCYRSQPVALKNGLRTTLNWKIDAEYHMIGALRICVASNGETKGAVRILSVSAKGEAEVKVGEWDFPSLKPTSPIHGFIATLNNPSWMKRLIVDNGDGVLVTGNRTWKDTSISCTLSTHCADRAGLVFNYQGLKRFYAVALCHGKFQLIRNFYGEKILFEKETDVREDGQFRVEASSVCGKITVKINGEIFAEAEDDVLACGGAGFYAKTGGVAQHGDLVIMARV